MSKKRFIDNVWNKLNSIKNLPNSEEITKWIDSGAADKFLKSMNWNWQKFTAKNVGPDGITPLYIYLIDAYFKYKQNGGSRSEKKSAAKSNPYEVFYQSDLKVVFQSKNYNDCDIILLKNLENENFIFAVPLSQKACIFMDSFKCGGQGAKWCIGYKKTDKYWKQYILENNLFILAYSKSINHTQNKIKYMIQLESIDEAYTWDQENKPSEYSSSIFGHNIEELFDAFNNYVFSYNTVYKKEKWIMHIDIPEGTTVIDEKAFSFYTSLKSITIPDSVTAIGADAFYSK